MAKINAGDRNAVGGADSARALRVKRGQATTGKKTDFNQTKSKADAPGGVQKGGGSLNYKETSAHKQANSKKKGKSSFTGGFDANSKKSWQGVSDKLSAAPLAARTMGKRFGETVVNEGPSFLKGEAENVYDAGLALPEFQAKLNMLMHHPDATMGITQDSDKVWDPYFNSDPFMSTYEAGKPVARGAASVTTFTGGPGLLKGIGAKLAGRGARAATPEVASVAEGLAGTTRRMPTRIHSNEPMPIPHTAPQQATANVYTGPAQATGNMSHGVPTYGPGPGAGQAAEQVPAHVYGGQTEDWMWNYAPEHPTAQLGLDDTFYGGSRY